MGNPGASADSGLLGRGNKTPSKLCLEVYLHILKSGFQIKRLQLETEERMFTVSGAAHDYRLAGVVYPNAGMHLSGSRLRGDFRASGMAGGLYRS